MSEPQQQSQVEGTQTSVGQSGADDSAGNAAPRSAQAAHPAFFDTLAAAGARLAQLREAKGWSVEDVSARLKVPTPKMRALEAGDISNLPGTTFALGVVRSYAKMLGVDPTPFAQALRRDKGEPEEPDLSMPASTGTDLPRGRVSVSLGGTPRHRSWWWGVAAVVVALIALVMWRGGSEAPAWFARLKASANGATANSAGQATQGETVASGVAIAAGNGNAASDPTAPAEAAAADAEGSGQASTGATAATASSTAAMPVAPVSQSGSAAPATPSVATTLEASAAAQPKAPAAGEASSEPQASQTAAAAQASGTSVAPGMSTVAFTVKQDSWFSVRDKSGKEVFSGIVHAGDTKEVQGAEPFKVVAGNRAGVGSITLDGKEVDAAKYGAGKGNVSRFSLP